MRYLNAEANGEVQLSKSLNRLKHYKNCDTTAEIFKANLQNGKQYKSRAALE